MFKRDARIYYNSLQREYLMRSGGTLLDGFRRMFPVSAEHGRGVDDLLDSIFTTLKIEPGTVEVEPPVPIEPTTQLSEDESEAPGEAEANGRRQVTFAAAGWPDDPEDAPAARGDQAPRALKERGRGRDDH